MFTGIVKEVGRVATRDGASLHIETAISAPIGASIAVNGACLTVVETQNGRLAFDVVEETYKRTNLGRLNPGDPVNLEPALTLDQPLDGHLVQGHVDGTATVISTQEQTTGRELTIEIPKDLAPYIAEKGSIAVDGTSLTVAGVTDQAFKIALIPHTLQHTIAHTYRPRSRVNLEVDVLARYAERLLRVK